MIKSLCIFLQKTVDDMQPCKEIINHIIIVYTHVVTLWFFLAGIGMDFCSLKIFIWSTKNKCTHALNVSDDNDENYRTFKGGENDENLKFNSISITPLQFIKITMHIEENHIVVELAVLQSENRRRMRWWWKKNSCIFDCENPSENKRDGEKYKTTDNRQHNE